MAMTPEERIIAALLEGQGPSAVRVRATQIVCRPAARRILEALAPEMKVVALLTQETKDLVFEDGGCPEWALRQGLDIAHTAFPKRDDEITWRKWAALGALVGKFLYNVAPPICGGRNRFGLDSEPMKQQP